MDVKVSSIDGEHEYEAELKEGTDWLHCSCGSQIFSIAYADFDDHKSGVIAECQECGQILVVTKE